MIENIIVASSIAVIASLLVMIRKGFFAEKQNPIRIPVRIEDDHPIRRIRIRHI